MAFSVTKLGTAPSAFEAVAILLKYESATISKRQSLSIHDQMRPSGVSFTSSNET